LADELVALGRDVVLFAIGDSQTSANLEACWPAPGWVRTIHHGLLHSLPHIGHVGQLVGRMDGAAKLQTRATK
jgi:hypothetical protein